MAVVPPVPLPSLVPARQALLFGGVINGTHSVPPPTLFQEPNPSLTGLSAISLNTFFVGINYRSFKLIIGPVRTVTSLLSLWLRLSFVFSNVMMQAQESRTSAQLFNQG